MSLQIHVHHLSTPATTLVRGLHLQIAPGTVHTLMGPSGSGKSSLLAAVCGTLPEGLRFDGEVQLEGTRIDTLPTQARRVGILFQEDLLFAHMTVGENLLFAVPAGPRAARDAQVAQALADVEMTGTTHANPATLSGGQRTRIALARALLAQPHALLLDEPFSKLDAALKDRMRALVFGLVKARNIPALLVTHDVGDVADAAHLTQLASS
ncbi:ATP-binding cassette domain-containing protein [Rhodoferax saidenbachensis]|uniref:ABC transporter ATP-binding protein n=1 Tax=Rhodoferax saidenbachensis TaxID=1484693 RepID=A0A1P8K727_9BURK|nr:ATP-binding cassette domain-containing protein [Rhodoferax saidenbachensis]APW41817.1 ABC transporter ATP-binding protein [Rhodoferax saidenbachensis]